MGRGIFLLIIYLIFFVENFDGDFDVDFTKYDMCDKCVMITFIPCIEIMLFFSKHHSSYDLLFCKYPELIDARYIGLMLIGLATQ